MAQELKFFLRVTTDTSGFKSGVGEIREGLSSIGTGAEAAQSKSAALRELTQNIEKAGTGVQQLTENQARLNAAGIKTEPFKATAAAVADEGVAFDAATGAVMRHTASHGNTRMAAMETMHSVRAVAEMLAMGMPVWRVAEMEGARYALVMATVNDSFRSSLLAATPWLAGIAAVGGAMALIAGRAATLSDNLRMLQGEFKAFGTGGSLTAADAQKIALASTRYGGTQSEALAGIQTFARTPNLPASLYQPPLNAAPGVADATGSDLATAQKKLADTFAKGVPGVLDLAKDMDFLTVREADQMVTMARHGDTMGALSLAASRLEDKVKSLHHEMASPAAAAFEELGRAWDGFLNKLANSSAIQTAAEKLGNLLGLAAAYIEETNRTDAANKASALNAEIDRLRAERDRWDATGPGDPVLANLDAQIGRKQDQLTALQRQQATAQAGTATPAVASLGGAPMDDAVAKWTKQTAVIQADRQALLDHQQAATVDTAAEAMARAEIEARRQAVNDGLGPEQTAERVAIARKNAVIDLNLSLARQATQLDAEAQGLLKLAQAYGATDAAAIRAAAAEQAMAEAATNSLVSVAARTRALIDQKAAEEAVSLAKGNRDLSADIDQTARLAAAEAQGAVAVRDATVANEKAEATRAARAAMEATDNAALKAQLADEIATREKLIDAKYRQQAVGDIGKMITQQREANELTAAELALVGATSEQRTVALAQLKAINELKSKGIDITKLEGDALKEANQYISDAAQGARLDIAKQRSEAAAADTQRIWVHAAEGVQDAFTSAFENLFDKGTSRAFDFASTVKQLLIRTAAEIASAEVFKPAMGSLLNALGLRAISEKVSPSTAGVFGPCLGTPEVVGSEPLIIEW